MISQRTIWTAFAQLFFLGIHVVAQDGSGTPTLSDIVNRQLLDEQTVGDCTGIGGSVRCEYRITRFDQFTNESADHVALLDNVQIIGLDPEDVGTPDLELSNVLPTIEAASIQYPDVQIWGASWINGRDPALALWSLGEIAVEGPLGDSSFPIALKPGESVQLATEMVMARIVEELPEAFDAELVVGWTFGNTIVPNVPLQAGDADQDLDFDQLDLVQVQQAARYLSGQPATWGQGDWDGAPGGSPGNPPSGSGQFDQLDIVAALAAGNYLQGAYGAIAIGGHEGGWPDVDRLRRKHGGAVGGCAERDPLDFSQHRIEHWHVHGPAGSKSRWQL